MTSSSVSEGWQKVRCPVCNRQCYVTETPVGWRLALMECKPDCDGYNKVLRSGWIIINLTTCDSWVRGQVTHKQGELFDTTE